MGLLQLSIFFGVSVVVCLYGPFVAYFAVIYTVMVRFNTGANIQYLL